MDNVRLLLIDIDEMIEIFDDPDKLFNQIENKVNNKQFQTECDVKELLDDLKIFDCYKIVNLENLYHLWNSFECFDTTNNEPKYYLFYFTVVVSK